jgi:hypothetical protein
MIFKSDTSGIDALLARVSKAQSELSRVTKDAAQRVGDTVKEQLSSSAPKGRGGPPPPTDAPGPLSGSFAAHAEQQGAGAHMELKTSQGIKLKFVTEGRGVVLPRNKRALFWPGLTHPVKRAGPSNANDFVTPVLNRKDDVVEAEMQKAIQEIKDIINANS